MYIVREKFDLLRRLGIPAREEALVLPWGEEHLGPARAMTNPDAPEWSAFASSSARVILSPTHRRPARRWPEASWAALADRLTREWNAAVVWLWGPGEEAETRRVMALCRERTFQALPTKFREMAALVAQADLFVANSNGPSHVAVAVKTPSLQLHGPTKAISWCPLTTLHRAVQSTQDGRMEGISLDDVWRQLEIMRPEIADHAARRRSSGQP
jgi:ADP-heptose:LPS heptosyltransferase